MTATLTGGVDCHIHQFGDPARYAVVAGRTYTPRPATLEEWRAVSFPHGIIRAVLVQPSVYGTDNTRLMAGLHEAGHDVARGVAVIGDATTSDDLEHMHRLGVRGVRLNLATGPVPPLDEALMLLRRTASRVALFGWHVQVLARGAMLAAVATLAPALEAPLVFDHMAGASLALHDYGIEAVFALLRAGQCWIKLSGADHVATRRDSPEQALPVMRRLIGINPEQLVWGSDWPHIGKAGGPGSVEYLPIDHGRLLTLLHDAAAQHSQAILSDNAARLYGWS